jgi:hypothetical protein
MKLDRLADVENAKTATVVGTAAKRTPRISKPATFGVLAATADAGQRLRRGAT